MFGMFAEDVGLLPEKLFHRLLHKNKRDPAKFNSVLARLFAAMSRGFGVHCVVP
jgi:hypothetical protein